MLSTSLCKPVSGPCGPLGLCSGPACVGRCPPVCVLDCVYPCVCQCAFVHVRTGVFVRSCLLIQAPGYVLCLCVSVLICGGVSVGPGVFGSTCIHVSMNTCVFICVSLCSLPAYQHVFLGASGCVPVCS